MEHKTDKDGHPRVVVLTPTMVELCQELAAKNPEGPLFRNTMGRPYTPRHVCHQFCRLRKHLKLPGRLTPYGYRHAFATELLVQNVSETKVAAALGHKGTKTLHSHYSHVNARIQEIRAVIAVIQVKDAAVPPARGASPAAGAGSTRQLVT